MKPYVRDLPATDADEDWCEILNATIAKFTTGAGRNLSPSLSLHLTEVLTAGDPQEGLFYEAKWFEIQGLLKRGTCKVVMRDEMPAGANMMDGHFVL
jgi:hypothetical protein